MTPQLDVRALQVSFVDRFHTNIGLRDVSFSVRGGDCLAVLGASGSGKSSLLRTLAGLQPSVAGGIFAHGRNVTTLPAEQRDVVYLHQEPVLFPHLRVIDNVAFPLVLRGIAKVAAQRRALEWLQRLHVGDVAQSKADALSGGQRHRVALARALCAEPAVLLLDEPLASLDPAVRRDVRAALLDARAASGAAMVLVTHDLDDAIAVATHIAAISGGRVTVPATPPDMLAMPPDLDTARLLGIFSEVPGTIVQGSGGAAFHWSGGTAAAGEMPAGSAIAVFRAHDVQLRAANETSAGALRVVTRSDAAHDILLTLRTDDEATLQLRVALGTPVTVRDVVHVTLANVRLFPTP